MDILGVIGLLHPVFLSDLLSRDLRRFKFESDVPIRFDSKVTGRFENF